jgi:CRP/FNR family transcriptional regulator, cyclic AMP receptor protein
MKTPVAFLKAVPLFRGLQPRDLSALARIARLREAKEGEILFSKAAKGDSLFIVVKGSVKIFSKSSTGKSKTFAYLETKDFFGEMGLLGGGVRSAAAMALDASVLLTIHRKDFESLLRRKPELSLALLRALCDRLDKADREIESFSFNSVLGRTAGILLQLGKKYGKASAKGLLIDKDISHRELADMAGTAREMVSRVLGRFTRAGCLASSQGRLLLTDTKKLSGWIL